MASLHDIAVLFAALLFLAAGVGYLTRRSRRRQLWARQRDLGTLRAMSWQEFEQLVGETFRRLDYQVRETGGGGADGGADLILIKKGRRAVVQCKHYKRRSVGVPIVREIVGVAIHEKAQVAFVVSVGRFTKAAQTYALGKPVTLIDGPALLQLIERGRLARHS
ncbi:restriction endonuclease [Accumulibacter sp.]|uniref:restriction endonuclease n=1 Tax=Accumulibacter sp. TaxID=2053492 RepID=UPI002878B1BF|nr:restriction endonuclease [Accumulibacter sp.]MDS4055356.1 restriction endonuclease [Accumulibacter sp.]